MLRYVEYTAADVSSWANHARGAVMWRGNPFGRHRSLRGFALFMTAAAIRNGSNTAACARIFPAKYSSSCEIPI